MAVPKRRTSKARRGKRQTNKAMTAPNIPSSQKTFAPSSRSQKFFCSNCNQPKPPHAVCPNCGFYRGRSLTEVEK